MFTLERYELSIDDFLSLLYDVDYIQIVGLLGDVDHFLWCTKIIFVDFFGRINVWNGIVLLDPPHPLSSLYIRLEYS